MSVYTWFVCPYRSFPFFLSSAVMSSPPVVRRESAGVTHTLTHAALHRSTHWHRQAEAQTDALTPRAETHRAESEHSPSSSLLPPLSFSLCSSSGSYCLSQPSNVSRSLLSLRTLADTHIITPHYRCVCILSPISCELEFLLIMIIISSRD